MATSRTFTSERLAGITIHTRLIKCSYEDQGVDFIRTARKLNAGHMDAP